MVTISSMGLEERKYIVVTNLEVLLCGFGRQSRDGKKSVYEKKDIHDPIVG